MKRIAVFLFLISIAVSLIACTNNGSVTTSAQEKELYTVKDLILHQEYSFTDHAEFTLLRVRQTDIIESSMRGKYYYENPTKDQTYIELVCDLANIGKKDLLVDELFEVVAVNKEGVEYNSIAYTEDSAYTEIVKDAVAVCNEVLRVHYVISVPDAEKDFTLAIRYDGISYQTQYTAGDSLGMPEAIELGSSVTQDSLNVIFNTMGFVSEILPEDISGYYSYYKAQEDNCFFVLTYDLNSTATEQLSVDDNVYVKLKFNNGESYECENITQNNEHDGFLTDPTVGTTSCVMKSMVEIPKSLEGEAYTVSFNINGTEYIIKSITA